MLDQLHKALTLTPGRPSKIFSPSSVSKELPSVAIICTRILTSDDEGDVATLFVDDVKSRPLMSIEELTSKLPSESTLPPEARADSVSDVSK